MESVYCLDDADSLSEIPVSLGSELGSAAETAAAGPPPGTQFCDCNRDMYREICVRTQPCPLSRGRAREREISKLPLVCVVEIPYK